MQHTISLDFSNACAEALRWSLKNGQNFFIIIITQAYNIPYSRKYWLELNLALEPQNWYCKNIGGFKFGGSVRDRHIYICRVGNFGRF